MNKILVAYTTNSGSTEEVARTIGEELGKTGAAVDVTHLDAVDGLDSYRAVIVGAPMILGWHRGAQRFIKKNQNALSRIPVAYFCTAMSLTRPEDEATGAVQLFIDDGLAQPPATPGKLSFKERFTTLPHYLTPILKAAPGIKPVSVAFFGGNLELRRLKFLQMLFVMLVIQAQPGDLRDWAAIRAWAAGLQTRLTSA